MISSAQCRAARGLLGWSQLDLSGVGTVAIHQLESGASQARRATLDVIRRAFEMAGIEFIDENGGGASRMMPFRRTGGVYSWRGASLVSLRTRRKAHQKIKITTPIAASGAARASNEISEAPPS